ncbi:membrane protein [Rhodococcus aetherivorans]|nr:membrane protein [Rhodococcus aetherivorans]
MVTLLALVGAVAELLSASPGVVPSLVLLGCVAAWGLTFRAWRRAGS